jgi:hypothetical protein
MTKPSIQSRLLDWRSDCYAYIAKRLDPPTSRQQVRRVAIEYDAGAPQSARIVKALLLAVRNRRYP